MVTGRRRQEWAHTAKIITELLAAWGVETDPRKLLPDDLRPPLPQIKPSEW